MSVKSGSLSIACVQLGPPKLSVIRVSAIQHNVSAFCFYAFNTPKGFLPFYVFCYGIPKWTKLCHRNKKHAVFKIHKSTVSITFLHFEHNVSTF